MASCPKHALTAEAHCTEMELMLEELPPELQAERDEHKPYHLVRALRLERDDLRAQLRANGSSVGGADDDHEKLVAWLESIPESWIHDWGLNAVAEITDHVKAGSYRKGPVREPK